MLKLASDKGKSEKVTTNLSKFQDLDLFIVAPNGDYASFCTIWINEKNKYGNFEPVGTHAEYQGMGFGRALLMEGFRRMRSMA